MEQIDVLAVVGWCAPERMRYAVRLAAMSGRTLVPAHRLAVSPDPVDEAASLASWTSGPQGTVFEFPGDTVVTELIGTLARSDAETRLTDVVCVVDAAHLITDLGRDSYAFQPPLPWEHAAGGRHTAHAMLAVTQLEYASMIVLVNWEVLATDDLSTVMALVSHLSPRARLRLDHGRIESSRPGAPYAVGQERPGWVALLNEAHDPHMTDPRVSALRYENLRPLHPGRLQRLLDERVEPGEFGTVIRSAGFCRFATRANVLAQWDHVGRMISFGPLGADDALGDDEDVLAFGQDLVFIGLDLDRDALAGALDDVALSDAEFDAGPETWGRLFDPFPAWPAVTGRTD